MAGDKRIIQFVQHARRAIATPQAENGLHLIIAEKAVQVSSTRRVCPRKIAIPRPAGSSQFYLVAPFLQIAYSPVIVFDIIIAGRSQDTDGIPRAQSCAFAQRCLCGSHGCSRPY